MPANTHAHKHTHTHTHIAGIVGLAFQQGVLKEVLNLLDVDEHSRFS